MGFVKSAVMGRVKIIANAMAVVMTTDIVMEMKAHLGTEKKEGRYSLTLTAINYVFPCILAYKTIDAGPITKAANSIVPGILRARFATIVGIL